MMADSPRPVALSQTPSKGPVIVGLIGIGFWDVAEFGAMIT
jgi:hypothetical protein